MTAEGRRLRRESGRLAWGLLIYAVLLVAAVTLQALLAAGGVSREALARLGAQSGRSGVGYLAGLGLGLPFLRFFYRKLERPPLLRRERAMDSGAFWRLLCVLMSAQMVFALSVQALEYLFNLAGYSVLSAAQQASAGSATLSMFLYASLLGPVAEELIFRGFVLRTLQKHGKTFAIVTSALLFGIYHGNLVQGIFAFLVGLVLGYTALEYSLRWSIALHILNNGVFGDLLLRLTGRLPAQTQNLLISAMDLAFFTAGLVILIRERGALGAYLRKNRTGGYRYVFASPGVMLFTAAMAFDAFLGLRKL